MADRARRYARARRNRFGPYDPARVAELTERFLTAATTGDRAGLLSTLAPNVTWITDSGGNSTAVRPQVTGAEQVAAILINLLRATHRRPGLRIELVNCDSEPAVAIYTRSAQVGRAGIGRHDD